MVRVSDEFQLLRCTFLPACCRTLRDLGDNEATGYLLVRCSRTAAAWQRKKKHKARTYTAATEAISQQIPRKIDLTISERLLSHDCGFPASGRHQIASLRPELLTARISSHKNTRPLELRIRALRRRNLSRTVSTRQRLEKRFADRRQPR